MKTDKSNIQSLIKSLETFRLVYTARQAAAMLQVSYLTIIKLHKSGKLKACKGIGRLRFTMEELSRFAHEAEVSR